MIDKFKSLRIRSQIFLIQLISMTLFSTILALLIYFSFQQIFNIFQNEAQKSLIMDLMYSSTQIQLSAYTKNVQYKVTSGLNNIENAQLFSHLIQSNNFTMTQNVSKCLQEDYIQNSVINHCEYCYGVFDCSQQLTTKNNYSQHFRNLSNLMTQMIPYQTEYNVYFSSISQDCYFSTCPGANFSGYVPSSREWFQNHILNMNKSEYIISDPYVNIFGGVYLTGTKTLCIDGKKTGIIAIDLNFSNIYQFYQNDQQLLVIDNSGRVLISKTYDYKSDQLQYLQNTSLFGFNSSQIQALINQTQNEQTHCQIPIPDTLCLQNKNTGINWYFKQSRITHSIISLLMFNSEAFESYLIMLNETLDSLMKQFFVSFLLFGLIGVIVIKIIIYFISFLLLQKPIEKLVNSFNRYLFTGNRIQFFFQTRDSQDQLNKLQEAFFQLAMNFNSAIDYKKHHNKLQQNLDPEYPINFILNSKLLHHKDAIKLKNEITNIQLKFLVAYFFNHSNDQLIQQNQIIF